MAKQNSHVITGTIVDAATRQGRANLTVRAFDVDRLTDDDALGEGKTSSTGAFTIRYRRSAYVKNVLERFLEGGPDLILKITDADGRVIHTTPRRGGASRFELYTIALRPDSGHQPPVERLVERTVFFQILDVESGAFLPDLTVTVALVDGDAVSDLGRITANDKGVIAVPFSIRGADRKVTLHLAVLGSGGHELHRVSVAIAPGQVKVMPLRVPMPPPRLTAGNASIADVEQASGSALPRALRAFLASHNIATIADLRNTGGLSRLIDLPIDAKDPVATMLDSHARLSALPIDLPTSGRLIAAGFRSPSDIAVAPPARFAARLKSQVDEVVAGKIHAEAATQTAFLNAVLIDFAGGLANRFSGAPGLANDLDFAPHACSCSGCNDATGPLAYLADLLDYTLSHLGNTAAAGDEVDIELLETTFHQPFAFMTACCEHLDTPERQSRLCIEVLRSYIDSTIPRVFDPPELSQAEAAYRSAAYFSILNRLGASYDQLRMARSAGADQRATLATRLGIDTSRLNALLLDPDLSPRVIVSPVLPQPITEQRLEALFGLKDTTRDRLSVGAKSGDTDNQLQRWRLEGAAWNVNTAADGRVYVRISKPTAAQIRVEVFKDATRMQLLAAGTTSTVVQTVRLSEEGASGLSGTVNVVYTTGGDAITIQAIPQLLAWRMERLRNDWTSHDWPTDDFTEQPMFVTRPFIDPDVIGPDDFRQPVAKANAGDPDKPFDVWIRRRAWVDARFAALSTERTTNGIAAALAQAQPAAVPDLDSLDAQLRDPARHAAAVTTVQGLGLTVEGFARLMEIRETNRIATADPARTGISADEWREVDAILTQAAKRTQYAMWSTEERQLQLPPAGGGSAALQFGPRDFWIARREPEPGRWNRERRAGQPRIDPAVVGVMDLPDGEAGARARAVLRSRQQAVEALLTVIKTARESSGTVGFETMLVSAFGAVNGGRSAQLDTIAANLANPDAQTATAARTELQTLHLDEDELAFLLAIKRREQQADVSRKPSAADWDRIYAVLARAKKERELFPQWVAAEDAVTNNLPFLGYWMAFKARLEPWLASADDRQSWRQALRVRSQPPLVDPDLIGPGDFRFPVAGDAAFDLWEQRRGWAHGLVSQFEATATGAAALQRIDQLIDGTLGVSFTALKQEISAGAGADSSRLDQLNLTAADVSFLSHLRDVASQPSPSILQSEWHELYSTLARIQQRRVMWAAWRAEERGAAITLSPDRFKLSDGGAVDDGAGNLYQPFTPQWRVMWEQRSEWRATLRTRVAQVESCRAGLADAVSATEAATLPALRDALVMATNMPGTTLHAKAEAVMARLLIDAREGGGHQTTRVVQAIQTLQGILWSVRTGQLQDTYPSLTLDAAAHFDEEWIAIGSYAAWRAAMLASMYPENILLPSLRPRQSPAFEALVAGLRANRQLTPHDACAAAQEYSDYLADVCSLELEACVDATTQTFAGTACDRTTQQARTLHYLFARAAGSSRAYWCTLDRAADAAHPQSFWHRVGGVNDVEILNIVGAAVYQPPGQHRGLYLFLIVLKESEQKFGFARYDLESGAWDNSFTTLDLTDEIRLDLAELKIRRTGEHELPEIGVFLAGGVVKSRRLGRDGKHWEKTEFRPVVVEGDWNHLSPRGMLDPPDADFDCSSDANAATFALVGDFNGDGIDEIAIAKDGTGDFWIRRFNPDTRQWDALPDLQTGLPEASSRLAIAGRFEGTDKTQIAIAKQGAMGTNRNDFRVFSFDVALRSWGYSEFSCSVSAHDAVFAIAGDFDADGRDEIAVHVFYETLTDGLPNNDFWAMDFVPGAGWRHLPSVDRDGDEDFFCSSSRGLKPRFAIAGDFDGDGRDELAVAVDYEGDAAAEADARRQRDAAVQKAHDAYNAFVKDSKDKYEATERNAASIRDQELAIASAIPEPNARKAAEDAAYGTYALAIAVDKAAYDAAVAIAAPIRNAAIWIAEQAYANGDRQAATTGNDFWVMRWDGSRWTHLSPIASLPYEVDLSCDEGDVQSKFALSGKFVEPRDANDAREQIAVAKATDDGNDFWVKRFDPVTRGWLDAGAIDCSTSNGYLTKTATAVAGDFDGDGRDEIAVTPERGGSEGNDFWVMDYDVIGGHWRHLSNSSSSFDADVSCSPSEFAARFAVTGQFTPLTPPRAGLAAAIDGNNDFWVLYYGAPQWLERCVVTGRRITPAFAGSYAITARLSREDVERRTAAFDSNRLDGNPNLAYFEEAWYFVPMQIALQLQLSGQYEAALDWLRTVYDYSRPLDQRKIYRGLVLEESLSSAYRHPENWLLDRSNPHSTAALRANCYTRYTLLVLIRCFLEYADQEFSRYTAESLPRATTLYLTALDLLGSESLRQDDETCVAWLNLIRRDVVAAAPIPPAWAPVWDDLEEALRNVPRPAMNAVHREVVTALTNRGAWSLRFAAANAIVSRAAAAAPTRPAFKELLESRREFVAGAHALLLTEPAIAKAAGDMAAASSKAGIGAWPSGPLPFRYFCIAANPVLAMLRTWAEVNLFKLRHSRNIAGELAPQPAFATDQDDANLAIGSAPSNTLSFTSPPRYRYSYLVEKARQHGALAQQLGGALLSAIEKRDQFAYSLLMAENALEVAGATVELKSLMVKEATHSKDVATKQLLRAAVQKTFWDDRLNSGFLGMGLLPAEVGGLALMGVSGVLQGLAAGTYFALAGPAAMAATGGGLMSAAGLGLQLLPTGYTNLAGAAAIAGGATAFAAGGVAGGSMVAQGLSSMAGSLSTFGSLSLTFASFQRRFQDWQLQQNLSGIDESIAHVQVTLADDRIAISEKDRDIGILQQSHDRAVVELLSNQFANEQLYDWMIRVLTSQYRTVVHIAVATARLAQSSLEFERQEPVRVIHGDYWSIEDAALTATQRGSGLLGAERLLTDIAQLDSFKTNTDRRHLQISRTFSLSQVAPQDFYAFRETGRIEFDTLLDWFDRDFPGHYLRLIKCVKVSVLAMVPPVDGIHAMLGNSGQSTVVVQENGQFLKKRSMRTFGEQIAIDAPYNETGLFMLNYDDPMFLPFEGLGVETRWTLELPRATNRFNFDTIVDVLLTIDYTAVQDDAYRNEVVERLGSRLATDTLIDTRVFFPDQWYHFKNPRGTTSEPLRLTLPRHAFAPNLRGPLKVTDVSAIVTGDGGRNLGGVSVRKLRAGATTSVAERQLSGTTSDRGVLSTRGLSTNPFANAPSVNPVGEWELTFPASLRQADSSGGRLLDRIDDVILVVTVEGDVTWS